MRCPTIPLLPILPGLFPAHELQFSLPADSMSMLVLLYIAVDVCLFVCCSPIQRHFQKQMEKKKYPEKETPHKRKTNRGNCKLQKGKQKQKNSSSIMRATEFHPSQKQTIHGKALLLCRKPKKPKLQRQLQGSRLASANNTKSVCAKEKGKSERGEARGERRLKPFSHASS